LTSNNYCESPADLYVKKESDSIQLECFKKSKNSICQLKSKFIKNLFKKDLSINSDLYYDKPARIEFNYTCGIYGNKSWILLLLIIDAFVNIYIFLVIKKIKI